MGNGLGAGDQNGVGARVPRNGGPCGPEERWPRSGTFPDLSLWTWIARSNTYYARTAERASSLNSFP